MSEERKEGDKELGLKKYLMDVVKIVHDLKFINGDKSMDVTFRMDRQNVISLLSIKKSCFNNPYDPEENDPEEEDEFFLPKETKLKPYHKSKIKLNYIG